MRESPEWFGVTKFLLPMLTPAMPGLCRTLPVLDVSILFEYFLYLLLHLMTLTTNAV